MKRPLYLLLCALACSCGSKGADVAALRTDHLIATTGPIPISQEHKLTSYDIERIKRHYPITLKRLQNYQPLHMQDIINMTRAGVLDDTIIHEINLTRSTFYLTPQNEQTLLQSGVSRKVINEMMDTAADHY